MATTHRHRENRLPSLKYTTPRLGGDVTYTVYIYIFFARGCVCLFTSHAWAAGMEKESEENSFERMSMFAIYTTGTASLYHWLSCCFLLLVKNVFISWPPVYAGA